MREIDWWYFIVPWIKPRLLQARSRRSRRLRRAIQQLISTEHPLLAMQQSMPSLWTCFIIPWPLYSLYLGTHSIQVFSTHKIIQSSALTLTLAQCDGPLRLALASIIQNKQKPKTENGRERQLMYNVAPKAPTIAKIIQKAHPNCACCVQSTFFQYPMGRWANHVIDTGRPLVLTRSHMGVSNLMGRRPYRQQKKKVPTLAVRA